MNKGVVSKETVVLRRWGSSTQKFGFINGVVSFYEGYPSMVKTIQNVYSECSFLICCLLLLVDEQKEPMRDLLFSSTNIATMT